MNSFGGIPSSLTYLLFLGSSSSLSESFILKKSLLGCWGLFPSHPRFVLKENWACGSFASIFSNGLDAGAATACWIVLIGSSDISSWYMPMLVMGQFFNKNFGHARWNASYVATFPIVFFVISNQMP